ncbi:peroxisomal membrane protein PMP34 [Danaus plexippus]|uniref:Peroxisomal membrane protein PMP34 n=1 Tax=Danaus plexippus plexippus TaxID=278856 RepID=A0A212F408_DANPL|nr:peroxisomal membrane protein PMP34 [Danaus plexippus]OWR48464.1 putative Peroxisomal membrane protein PMP34 [Danaus plexippus plexippus]
MTSSLLSYETLTHAIAGATGSVVGMAAFYPLDTIRSRLQVDDTKKLHGTTLELLIKLTKEEGIEALYHGLGPVLQSLSVSNFVYFYVFHSLRRVSSASPSAARDLLIGMVAGSVNVLLTSPLWVVNTRMKLEKNSYSSLFEGLLTLFQKEGVKGLWSGTLPSLLLVSNPAIQFMVYESLKRKIMARGKFDIYSAFAVGAVAKGIATTLTYPLQLFQSRLRAGTSLKPLFKDIKKHPATLFRGLEAKLLQTIMTAALMFLIYEKVFRLVLTIMRVKLKKH